jgi:chemotaxis protein MotB
MAARNEKPHGGHGWFVTFADLMGLLVSFFVMLVAFSNQDMKKLQIVAGSMRDAFGVQTAVRYSGIVEVDGLPTRPKLKNAAHIRPEDASATPTPDQADRKRDYGAKLEQDQAFALAAASLRQALQDMPELTEASKHIMFEETKEGFNIELVDQEGRSMFPEGSKDPYPRTREIIEKLAAPLKATPYRISITGHTAASKTPPQPGLGPWELSAGRANAVRRILEEQGLPSNNIYEIAGKADTDPLFADDPFIAANRRVTITLMREAPPVPPDLHPESPFGACPPPAGTHPAGAGHLIRKAISATCCFSPSRTRRETMSEQPAAARAQPVRNLTADEVARGIAEGRMLLVDVREPNETAHERFPGAVLVPLSAFNPAAIPVSPGCEVVFACRSGRRSVTASVAAQEQGFAYCCQLAGGILAWKAAGLPTET